VRPARRLSATQLARDFNFYMREPWFYMCVKHTYRLDQARYSSNISGRGWFFYLRTQRVLGSLTSIPCSCNPYLQRLAVLGFVRSHRPYVIVRKAILAFLRGIGMRYSLAFRSLRHLRVSGTHQTARGRLPGGVWRLRLALYRRLGALRQRHRLISHPCTMVAQLRGAGQFWRGATTVSNPALQYLYVPVFATGTPHAVVAGVLAAQPAG
jgi:hypothetical protein